MLFSATQLHVTWHPYCTPAAPVNLIQAFWYMPYEGALWQWRKSSEVCPPKPWLQLWPKHSGSGMNTDLWVMTFATRCCVHLAINTLTLFTEDDFPRTDFVPEECSFEGNLLTVVTGDCSPFCMRDIIACMCA